MNISSDAADSSPWPGLVPYATAKVGLHSLTRTLAVELGPTDILSNALVLGVVLTERNRHLIPAEQVRQPPPTRRLITPEDVAAAIVFRGSQVNRQITGKLVHITGGKLRTHPDYPATLPFTASRSSARLSAT